MSWFSRAFSRQNDHARQLVADGALLLDVRTTAEYAGGHLEGAVNIPVQQLGARVAEVGAKSRPVVVYCRSGGRSCSAAGLLTKAGYQVVDVGGMGAY